MKSLVACVFVRPPVDEMCKTGPGQQKCLNGCEPHGKKPNCVCGGPGLLGPVPGFSGERCEKSDACPAGSAGKSCKDGGAGKCLVDKNGMMNCVSVTGMCLEIAQSNWATNARIQVWPCNNGTNQKWQYKDSTLYNPASGKCLDIWGGCYWKGSECKAALWPCNNGKNQEWHVKDGALVNPYRQMCLDVFNGVSQGAHVQMFACHGGANQKWRFDTTSVHVAQAAGDCLETACTGTNCAVKRSKCQHGKTSQQWVFKLDPSKRNTLYNPPSGKCLDIWGGCYWKGNNCKAAIWPCNNNPNQAWVMKKGALFNDYKKTCLTGVSGQQLTLSTCKAGDSQNWLLTADTWVQLR